MQLFQQANALAQPTLAFVNILCTQDECSYVSLRDVVRAMIVFEWFLDKLSSLQELKELLHQKERQADVEVRSCYCTLFNYLQPLVLYCKCECVWLGLAKHCNKAIKILTACHFTNEMS